MQSVLENLKSIRLLLSREGLRGFFGVSLYRNAIFLIIANVINALFGFVFWIVAARFYTAEEVGLGSASISAAGLLASFASLGLGYGLIRFLPRSHHPARMVNTLLTVNVLTATATAWIFLAGLGLWSPALAFIREDPLFLVLFIIFTIIFTVSGLVESAFVAGRHAGFTVTKSLIFGGSKIILAGVLAAWLASFGIISSWGIATGLAILVSFIWLLPRAVTPNPAFPLGKGEGARAITPNPTFPLGKGEGARRYRVRPALDTGVLKETARFSAGNYVSALLWSAPSQVLPLMIVNQIGAAPNAYFYVALNIAGILFTVPTMISTSLFAEGSYDEKSLRHQMRQSLKLSFIILAPILAAVLLTANYLLLPFGRVYAAEGANLLRILAISALPLAVNVLYLGVKRVEMKLGTLIAITGVITAVTLGVSYLLIPRMGINGAGWAWLVGQGVVAACIIINSLRG
jgi:O-antigen/teichoic acid export membrane protein